MQRFSKLSLAVAVISFGVSVARAATDTWSGGGGDNNWKTGANWVGGLPPTVGDILDFAGTTRTSPNNNFSGSTAFGGIIFDATALAPFTLTGNAINLSGDITDSAQGTLDTIGLNLALQTTPTVSIVTGGSLTVSGIFSGSFGLNETGGGLLTLASASNTFSGPITVGGGSSLSVTADGNLGAVPGAATPGKLILNNGTLSDGTFASPASFTINANRGIALGPGSGAGSGTLNVFQNAGFDMNAYTSGAYTGASTVTYGGVIANNGGIGSLVKTGFGGVTLSGANTYSGTTAIRSGTIRLDFSAANAPTNNILYNGLGTPGPLVLGGAVTSGANTDRFAALVVTGKNSTTNSQSFSSTNLDAGKSYVRVNSGTSGTANVDLGPLTHSTGGYGVFVLPTSGAIHTTTANTNGILGGWATVSSTITQTQNSILGNTFAAVDGSGNIVAYSGYTNYTLANDSANLNLHDSSFANKNVMVVGGAAATHSPISVQVDASGAGTVTDVNTISFQGASADGDTVYIGAGNTLRLGRFGSIFRQDTVNSFNTYIGGVTDTPQTGSGTKTPTSSNVGTLTAGGADNTPGEIYFNANSTNNNTGRMIVEAKITDNGTGPVTVVKAGSMGIKVNGHNTYTGGTYILEGIIQLAGNETSSDSAVNPDGLGTGPVYVNPGAQFFANAATFSNNFFVAGIGTNQENFGVIRGTTNTILTGVWTLTGDTRLGARGATAAGTQFLNKITDNGNGFALTIGDGGATGNITLANPNTTLVDGGTRTVSTNDWTGSTIIGFGITLLGLNEQIPDGVGKGNVQLNSSGTAGNLSILDLNGHNETINGLTNIGNAANANIFVRNSTGSATLTLGNFDQTTSFRGVLQDNGGTLALTKIGKGMQTLSGANTYSGATNINAGILSVTGSLNTSGTVNVNVSATGAGTLAGTGTVGTVVLSAASGANKAAINPGASGLGSVGTLSTGPLTVNSGGDLQFDLVSPGASDVINVNGALNFSGASTVTPSGVPLTNSNYTVVSASSISGTKPTLVTSNDTRLTFAYDSSSWDPVGNPSATQIVLHTSGAFANVTWTGTGDGSTWDLHTTANWTSAAPTNPNLFFNGDSVTFDDTGAPNYSVSLGSTVQPTAVTVNNSAGDYTISGGGSIAGTGTLVKNGTSALTIATGNSFSGGTTLNAGALNLNNNGALGTGPLAINGGSLGNTSGTAVTLSSNPTQTWTTDIVFNGPNDLNLGTGAVTSTVSVGTNRTITVNGGTLTIGGSITDSAGTDGLIKAGNGTLTLGANNTFSGPVAINGGTLKVGTFGALGTGATGNTVASGAALDLGGVAAASATGFGTTPFTISGSGVGGAGAIINSGTVAQLNAFQSIILAADATIGGTGRFDIRSATAPPGGATLDLAGHTLTKTGSNQISIVNAAVTAGNIVVNQGTLSIESGTTIPNNNDGTNITVNTGATLGFFANTVDGGGNSFVQRPIVLNGAGITVMDFSGANATATVGSNMTLKGSIIIGSTNATANMVLAGTLTESGGSYSITKTGPGVATFKNTNVYSGGTFLNGGLINFTSMAANLGSGNFTFAGGGLQYASGLVTPDDLSTRTMTFNAGGGTIDTNGNNVAFANSIGNGGAGGFTKAGNGTLTLNGTSTYLGSTTVANGTLVLASASSFTNGTPLIIGATTAAGDTGGTLDMAGHNITVSALSTVGANFNQIGSSSNTTNVTITYAGGANPSTFGGAIQDSVNGGSGHTTSLVVSTGTLILTASNNYSGPTTINNGATLQLGNGTGSSNASINNATAITDNGSLVFNQGFLTVSNSIAGSGSVTQNGAGGVTTLSNPNSYTGGTTLQAGTLAINSDAAINNGVGGIAFTGGTLRFNSYTSNLSFSSGNVSLGADFGTSQLNGNITTPGNLTYAGPGTLVLAGTNTYAGNTNIQNGTLTIGSALPATTKVTLGDSTNDSPTLDLNGHNVTVVGLATIGTGNNVIGNSSTTTDATLTFNGNATASTFAGSIQDTTPNNGGSKKMSVIVNGGALTLTGPNTYTGATTVNQGTLTLGASGTISSTSKLILGGGKLSIGGTDQTITSAALRVNASSTIDLGTTSGSLHLADSSGETWASSALGSLLRINNWTNGTDHIFFDITSGTGLTGTPSTGQVSQIHFTGFRGTANLVPQGSIAELVPATSTILTRGDFTGDGLLNASDLTSLEQALTDLSTYQAGYPGGALTDYELPDVVDVNNDGVFNNADLQAELRALATGVAPGANPPVAVPEPSSLLLLAIGAASVAAIRRRRVSTLRKAR